MRIKGTGVDALDGRTLPVTNPATGETIGSIPRGTAGDVHRAAEAAELAAPGWEKMPMRARGKILFTAAQAVRKNVDGLARQLTTEQGKPLREAADEIRGFCNVLEYYAACSGLSLGQYSQPATGGEAIIRYEPVGPCGAIIPWNMPALIMAWKAAPALLAGNPVILKPSSTASLTVIALSALMEQAGLPPGTLNVVTGTGREAGEALARERSIRVLSFTGSTETGETVRELASRRGTTVTCELGGSDPMVVMPDADPDAAVQGARLYVHEQIAQEVISRLEKAVAELPYGNGLDPATRMGPLNNLPGKERIGNLLDSMRERSEGNVKVLGLPGNGVSDKGYFQPPTLVTDIPPSSRLVTEEVFGPVLPVTTVPDLSTAIRLANSSPYGLGASVWTHDSRVIRRFFSEVHAGVVWVNRHVSVPPEIPFGGTMASGSSRENGSYALLNYMKSKTLYVG